MRIRTTGRIRDSRVEDQIREIQRQSDEPPLHAELHYRGGKDEINPSDIGAETSLGAQQKAEVEAGKALDQARLEISEAVTVHEGQEDPHSGYQKIRGGVTIDRPIDPGVYEMYFDINLNKAIWWNGSEWVDATGIPV